MTSLILSDLFVTRKKKHNLRNFQALKFLHKQTVTFGAETTSYWRSLNVEPDAGKMKSIGNIKQLLKKKQKSERDVCPCRMCRTYTQYSGCMLLTKNFIVLFSRKLFLWILLVFLFYWQHPLTKNLYRWYYFTLVMVWIIFVNVLQRIARFVKIQRESILISSFLTIFDCIDLR